MKRYHDWYKLQKDFQGWDAIQPDIDVVNIVSKNNWCLNLDHCHASLKNLLEKYHMPKEQVDFFVITDPELSKFPLDVFFKLVTKHYKNSSIGGYMAHLSYYLNTRKKYSGLGDSYSKNINMVFDQELSFANRLEDCSVLLDYPITKVINGQLVEGSNFIFVHPNIRYFLWKQ
jgi:hypothetical protein